MNSTRRTRTLLTTATDNWLSRGYLAVVAAATVFFLADTFLVSHPDASMSGAVPWLLTAPLSLMYTLLPPMPTLTATRSPSHSPPYRCASRSRTAHGGAGRDAPAPGRRLDQAAGIGGRHLRLRLR